MEIPLVEGRVFGEGDVAGSPPVIVLTRTTAALIFPGESALGRRVAVDLVGAEEPGLFRVVGVVEDHQLTSLSGETGTAMFFPHTQRPVSAMRIAVGTAVDPNTLVQPIQEKVWELESGMVLSEPRTMEDAVSGSISDLRSITTVLGIFAAAAVVLAALGLYGALALFVTRRNHEIGIRIALGATGGKVLRLIIARGVFLVGSGVVIGIAGALGATRLMEGMLFQISATDPATFAGVTGLFIMVAIGACLLPVRRAVKVDPMRIFRTG